MSAVHSLLLPSSEHAVADWYKDAVIYQLHVKSFMDGNDDGIGDFKGLLQRIDYIASLGVDTLWLLPFYPSPRRDDGYDVADYLNVHPDYGSFDDLRRFLDAAHQRGLRVIGDLVLNHTSDLHPWFQRARRAPRGSSEHDFYVWSDDDQRYAGTRIIFPDVETSNWAWDAQAQRYYFHRFYSHQPDLNYANPAVLDAVLEVLRFWLKLGLDGFRLDAVAYLTEREGTSNENLPETHAILKRLRAEIDAQFPDRVLLAEANQWPEDMQAYFGDDDECHMAFHFPLMPRMYMAIAQEDRLPITDILRQTPAIPPRSQWAIFLRNHDELTLEMVSDTERDYLWDTYASDRRARLNLGIRRRLAPLLQRDRRRIELMSGLLFTLPGTPVLYYGDEIGMGDDLHLGDRDGVRTPMQWSMDRNGGFSRAESHRLTLPVIDDAVYGYQAVNVEAQEHDPHSLLHWTRQWLAARRRFGELFGRGRLHFIYPRNRKVLCFLREWKGMLVLCVANLSRSLQAVQLDLSAFATRIPIEILGGSALPVISNEPYPLTLAPYGFHAFELAGRDRLPDWYRAEPEPPPDMPTLVLREALPLELDGSQRESVAAVLPDWLRRRRGIAAGPLELQAAWPLPTPSESALLHYRSAERPHSPGLLAVAAVWDEPPHGSTLDAASLSRLRRGARTGRLIEAQACRTTLEQWRDAWEASADEDRLRFRCEPGAAVPAPRDQALDLIGYHESADAALLDRSLLVTCNAFPAQALNGPLALERHLQACGFSNHLPLVGVADCRIEGEWQAFAYAQAWRTTQGDALEWTMDALYRGWSEYRAASDVERAASMRGQRAVAELLGRRLAELHRCLAEIDDDTPAAPAASRFDAPGPRILRALRGRIDGLYRDVLDDTPPPRCTAKAVRERLREIESRLAADGLGPPRRVHGDLILPHILLDAEDLCFIRFADPPALLRADRGRSWPAIDLAEVLAQVDRVCARFRLEFEDASHLLVEFLQAFRTSAKEGLFSAYGEASRGWNPDSESASPWLNLLQAEAATRGVLRRDALHAARLRWEALCAALQLD